MTDVAEEVVSGLHDHNRETHSLYEERAETAKSLHKVESQAVAGFRKITEEAQIFAIDTRGTIKTILNELYKTISDISSTFRKNISEASKVSKVFNACTVFTYIWNRK